jgi:hypothetical protein
MLGSRSTLFSLQLVDRPWMCCTAARAAERLTIGMGLTFFRRRP